MTSLRRALWALAAVGVAFGLAVLALILTSVSVEPAAAWGAAALIVGWSYIGVGMFAWGRRPDNRVGMLMAATGFAWLVAASRFSDLPLVFTLGNVLGSVFFAVAVHLLLAFPSGRLQSRTERWIVGSTYFLTTVAVFPLWFFADPQSLDCNDCPDNVLLISANDTVVDVLGGVLDAAALVLVIIVMVYLVGRYRRARQCSRRFSTSVSSTLTSRLVAIGA